MKVSIYIKLLLFSLIIFISFHFIVWHYLTKNFFTNDNNTTIGDLGRISYSLDSLYLRENEIDLDKLHFNYIRDKDVDVLTIGDSFSNGMGGGLNPFYQDYISTKFNKNVMNIQAFSDGFIETVLMLINTKVIDGINPKVIILQSIERLAIDRFAKDVNWDISSNNKSIDIKLNKKYKSDIPNPYFINNINYNALIYNTLYYYDSKAYISNVYRLESSKKIFSSKNMTQLLVLSQDLENIKKATKNKINKLNENLNRLSKILKEKNIKLYLLLNVDKYNLYFKYLLEKKEKNSILFEELEQKTKEYEFINTKKILLPLIDKGDLDIYYSDDTHWSFDAIKEVFNKVDLP
jgi:hypothetical protein